MGPARLATPQTRAEEPLDARALAQREEVAGHDERDGHEAARPESLQHAGGDELGHGPCAAAQVAAPATKSEIAISMMRRRP